MILKWHVAAMGVNTNAYTIFVEIPDGKNQLWSLKRRWEYNTEKVFHANGVEGRRLGPPWSKEKSVNAAMYN